MKYLLEFLFILLFIECATALECYDCADNDIDGSTSEKCVKPTEGAAKKTCELSDYCRTVFTITDGVVNIIKRECINNATDEDIHSNDIPIADKCVTTFKTVSNPTSSSKCYFHCSKDNCNKETTDILKRCTSSCNNPSGGHCDYIIGQCVCNSGFTGENCTQDVNQQSSAKRSCVQCTSATKEDCATSTAVTPCPANEMYCSTTNTTLINANDKVVGPSVITRGCTAKFAATDQCYFTDIFSDPPINNGGRYKEYTCVSTCNADGCNTNAADGIIGDNEQKPLHCVVCTDATGSGECSPDKTLQRTPCPADSKYCKSTVSYFISNKSDLNYAANPSYSLRSVVRECAKDMISPNCTSTNIGGSSLEKVTCSETCQEDGCNIGWPARPNCIQCEHLAGSTDVICLLAPPAEKYCGYPYQEFCYIQDQGITNETGHPRSIKRGCSSYNMTNDCSTKVIRDVSIDSCNVTCKEDGCNFGYGRKPPIKTPNGATTAGLSLFFTMFCSILGNLVSV